MSLREHCGGGGGGGCEGLSTFGDRKAKEEEGGRVNAGEG